MSTADILNLRRRTNAPHGVVGAKIHRQLTRGRYLARMAKSTTGVVSPKIHGQLTRRRYVALMAKSKTPQDPFRYFNSSPEVIRLVVMMYVRLPLTHGDGEASTISGYSDSPGRDLPRLAGRLDRRRGLCQSKFTAG